MTLTETEWIKFARWLGIDDIDSDGMVEFRLMARKSGVSKENTST